MRVILRLWHDDVGSGLITAEWLFLFTTLILGSVSGLVALRHALIGELNESAQAILAVHQNFSFSAQSNAHPSTGGSSFSDSTGSIGGLSTPASTAAIKQTVMD